MARIYKIIPIILVSIMTANSSFAGLSSNTIEPPLVRGPGISQMFLETYAEAQARTTLADHLDLNRPGEEASNRIRTSIESAQRAWLAGSIESARSKFQGISGMAMDADWREPQREVIHYAHLRLAQSAKNSVERTRWLES